MRIIKAAGPSGTDGIVDYTEEINMIPNTYGRIRQAGLFGEVIPTSQLTVNIDKIDQDLVVLPERPRGADATVAAGENPSSKPFNLLHIPHRDAMRPGDLQDRRMPGSQMADTATRVRTRKLEQIRRKHALTREYLEMQSLKGILVGGSGTTIHNWYTEFSITQKIVYFDLTNASSDIDGHIAEVLRHIEDNVLNGQVVNGAKAYVDPTFFDALIAHAKVVDAYKYFQASNQVGGLNPTRDDMRRSFYHRGLIFEEYRANVKLWNATSTTPFIAAGEGHAFPLGVDDLFETYAGPADRFGYENTEGEEVYVFEFEDPKGKVIDIESEAHILPICKRPGALVKLDDGTAP